MDPRATADPTTSLALWLRAGRAQRRLSLDDIARITKIQPRILEKLESGQLDGLPAEVFVRGFVRSFAKCVGLDEREALERFGAIASSPATPVVRALVDTMSDLAPVTAKKIAMPLPPVVEVPVDEIPVSSDVETPPIAAVEPVEGRDSLPAVSTPEWECGSIKGRDSLPAVSTPEWECGSIKGRDSLPAVSTPEWECGSIEAAPAVEPPAKKKRTRKKPGTTTPRPRSKRASKVAQAVAPEVATAEIIATSAPQLIEVLEISPEAAEAASTLAPVPHPVDDVAEGSAPVSTAQDTAQDHVWQPTMPPIATTPSVPWRRPTFNTTTTYAAPILVLSIDDSDPELAELERDEREAAKGPHRVSFLPPILLDRDDKSARQGGLTLAVIILLIAATLTLSYLMRRPSVSGAGVTIVDPSALPFGSAAGRGQAPTVETPSLLA